MSSYVRYNQNNNNDFDGRFLNSLSLEDTETDSHYTTADHQSQTRYLTAEEEDEDDFMDIDHTYDTLLHQISNRSVNYDSTRFHSAIGDDNYDFDNEMDALIRETRQLTPVGKITIDEGLQSTPNDENRIDKNVTVTEYDTDEEEEETEEEEEGHTSFVSHLFSPTTLGAQLAIRKPQLLLLPPPTASSNPETSIDSTSNDISESIDYDYDFTISNNNNVRHLTTYTPKVNASSLFGNSSGSSRNASSARVEIQEADEEMEEAYYPNNGANIFPNQHLQRNNMESPFIQSHHQHIHNHNQPVQILHQHQHHHHYYSNNNEGKKSKKQDTQSSPISPEHNDKSVVSQQHDSYPKEANLPLPWESNITPSERIPYLLSSYLQLLINIIVYSYALYLVVKVVSVVKKDINVKLNQFTSNMLVEIESCKRSYYENNCSPELRSPVIDRQCTHWEKCMNRITANGGGHISVVSAETVGIILNAFVEPLGLKFFMMLTFVVLILFLFNFVFGYIRAKTYYGWHNKERYLYESNESSRIMGESRSRLVSPRKQSPIKEQRLLTPSQNGGRTTQFQLQY
ncbi:Di-sulfide bridge nucleocytoplasmic transport domain-containing protein [Scheffersomyces coipomensis]|uniref:Di-sulfide bridge nucleocytoplasmic transport domain-containing protein n=1 Tax=Scheffersomyces coipomensis TaxID=1788519 RepID=UPI00315D292C